MMLIRPLAPVMASLVLALAACASPTTKSEAEEKKDASPLITGSINLEMPEEYQGRHPKPGDKGMITLLPITDKPVTEEAKNLYISQPSRGFRLKEDIKTIAFDLNVPSTWMEAYDRYQLLVLITDGGMTEKDMQRPDKMGMEFVNFRNSDLIDKAELIEAEEDLHLTFTATAQDTSLPKLYSLAGSRWIVTHAMGAEIEQSRAAEMVFLDGPMAGLFFIRAGCWVADGRVGEATDHIWLWMTPLTWGNSLYGKSNASNCGASHNHPDIEAVFAKANGLPPAEWPRMLYSHRVLPMLLAVDGATRLERQGNEMKLLDANGEMKVRLVRYQAP